MQQGGSEYNRADEVVRDLAFPAEVFIVDSTIRSLQSTVSGSLHSAADLVDIGVALGDLGVRELLINTSWRDGLETVRGLAERRPKARIVASFRARNPNWRDWTAAAAEAGADEICLESAADSRHLEETAGEVRRQGLDVSHSFAEWYTYPEVVDLCKAGVQLGCRSQSFHDSYFHLGIHPEAMKYFIKSILSDVVDAPPLYVHLSNFYGHATMTTVAALAAGASGADVCANGTGHHAGHTQLAEVALVLEHLYGRSTGIHLEKLTEISRLVEERSRVPVPLTQPVYGSHAFMGDAAYWSVEAHLPPESRVHAMFPFSPESVGSRELVVWNDRTLTREIVASTLQSLGLPSGTNVVNAVVGALRETVEKRGTYPGWMEDREFTRLARRVADPDGGSGGGRGQADE